MTGKPLRAFAALVCLALLAPTLSAEDRPDNDQVGRQVDEITRPPDYDWLRGTKHEAQQGEPLAHERGKARAKTKRAEPRERDEGCDYQPEPQGGPDRAPANKPEGSGGCGSGPAPGSQGGGSASAPPSGPDCGCDVPAPNCGCDRAIGNCGGCPGIGAAIAPLGYLVGAAVLALIIFFVVRAIVRRDRSPDKPIAGTDDVAGPEEIRFSQLPAVPVATMMERAVAAAAAGDYKIAVGWAYLAGISNVHEAGFTPL
ncbi:MAG: hypothetical protein M0R80_19905, partial [Proteobacteria bacterium]|nr:hypothetical protein [Pseudomonadota bacterium]